MPSLNVVAAGRARRLVRLGLAGLLALALPAAGFAQDAVPIPAPRPVLPSDTGQPPDAPVAGELRGGAMPFPLAGAAPAAGPPSAAANDPGAPLALGPVEPGAPIPLVGPAGPSNIDELPFRLTPQAPPIPTGPTREFSLAARLTADGPTISDGLVWRVFGTRPGPDGRLPLVTEAEGGVVDVQLAEGPYYVHAAFGRAGVTKRVDVPGPIAGDTLVLNAGGLRFDAALPDGTPLPADLVSFDIYLTTDGGEGLPVLTDLKSGEIISLNAGTYQIVSRFGDANAQVSADITVEPGNLTEAIMYHRAARLTLKLVNSHGGEALANTKWSVVTPGGDEVFESIGAFPTVVLAAGDYVAIAQHDDQIFEGTFTVAPDLDRDVEVIAANPSNGAVAP